MERIKKATWFFVGFILIRILFSSCDCNTTPILFNLDHAIVTNIENSGEWAGESSSDTMLSKAVAFKITVGSIESPFSYAKFQLQGFGFASAYAMECPTPFKPNQEIKNVKITNVFPVNPSIPINTELSENNIVYAIGSSLSSNDLYVSKKTLLNKINPGIVSDIPEITFLFFLKDQVENTKAQFNITIELSDGQLILAQTRVITIF